MNASRQQDLQRYFLPVTADGRPEQTMSPPEGAFVEKQMCHGYFSTYKFSIFKIHIYC